MKVTNIEFIDFDGTTSETQFDTTDERELALLWWKFCREEGLIDLEEDDI